MSPRIKSFNPEASNQGLRLHNDLIEELKDEAAAKILLQQAKTAAYFNKKVKVKQFLINDLVLRESTTSQPTTSGKFKAPWEGFYRVSKVVAPGTYELSHVDGSPIKNTWNGIHLKKFYQ